MAKTFFIDIDGTLVNHLSNDQIYEGVEEQVLPDASQFVQTIYNEGHYVVLTTARLSRDQEVTEEMLNKFEIPYHHIIFDLGSEERILINDIKPPFAQDDPTLIKTKPTAYAINVERNKGFNDILRYDFMKLLKDGKQYLWQILA